MITTYRSNWNQVDALPRISGDISHTLLPLPFNEHDGQNFDGVMLSSFVEREVNNFMDGEKFLLSCDPRHFVALSLKNFSYEIVSAAAQNGGANTHFVLFDGSRNFWMTFCSEFPFVVISQKNETEGSLALGKTNDFWVKFYSENAQRAVRLVEPEFIDFLNKTYLPRLRQYPRFSIA